jgi:hypothetical protein
LIGSTRRNSRELGDESSKHQLIIIVCEQGNSVPTMLKSERAPRWCEKAHIFKGSPSNVDEVPNRNELESKCKTHSINHREGYNNDDAYTNMAEDRFNRLCRAKIEQRWILAMSAAYVALS